MKLRNPLIKLFYTAKELHQLELMYENQHRIQLHLRSQYKYNHDTN